MRIGLFDGGAGVRDAIGLGERGRVVDVGAVEHRLKLCFFGLKRGVELDELEPVLEVDLGKAADLVGSEAEALDDDRILPEISGREADFVKVLHFVVLLLPQIAFAMRGGGGSAMMGGVARQGRRWGAGLGLLRGKQGGGE